MKYLILLSLLTPNAYGLTCKANGSTNGIKSIVLDGNSIVFIDYVDTHVKFNNSEDGQIIKRVDDNQGTTRIYLAKDKQNTYTLFSSFESFNKDEPCTPHMDETKRSDGND